MDLTPHTNIRVKNALNRPKTVKIQAKTAIKYILLLKIGQ